MTPLTLKQIPLRERKAARTRLNLLAALLRFLETKPFDAVTIREICDAVPVSEATFFNYFAKKSDILFYFTNLWAIEALTETRQLSGLQRLEALFHHAATRIVRNPRIMLEITSALAQQGEPEYRKITLAERLTAFPRLKGVGETEGARLTSLFRHELEQAIAAGELPATIDLTSAVVAVTNIFFGVPMYFQLNQALSIPRTYQQLLTITWAGFRAEPLGL